jgi:membrane protein
LKWRDVWIGALVTAILFTVGKSLTGLYLAKRCGVTHTVRRGRSS